MHTCTFSAGPDTPAVQVMLPPAAMQAWLRAGAGALPPCPVPEALRALFTREAAALAVGILLVLAAVRALAWTARFVWVYWLRAGVDPLSFGGKGSWAVVTGASEGIGRAYAGLLAERGINIVLVALPEPRLHEAAAELGVQYGVQTRVMPLDLATAHDDPHAFAATVGAALAGIEARPLSRLLAAAGSAAAASASDLPQPPPLTTAPAPARPVRRWAF